MRFLIFENFEGKNQKKAERITFFKIFLVNDIS